jgi:hypothetical protein
MTPNPKEETIMMRTVCFLATAVVVLTVIPPLAVPASAATPAEKCQAGKNKAAGKYDSCRQKVDKKETLAACRRKLASM